MGSYSILVIGDDWREQINRHAELNYRDLPFRDVKNDAKSIFKTLNKNNLIKRAKERYGINQIHENQEPETWGRHSLGWIRLDDRNNILEIMVYINEDGSIYSPSDMGSAFLFCHGTISGLLLKQGVVGYDIEWYGDPVATESWAGSARKRDIDFHSMREASRKLASEIWTQARAICGSETWVSLEKFCEKYKNDPRVWERYTLAKAEWAAQQPVSELLRAGPIESLCYLGGVGQERLFKIFSWPHWQLSGLDLLMLPHDKFIARYGIGTIIGHSEVLRDGILRKDLSEMSEDEFLNSIGDDELITLVSVKH